MVDSGVIKKYTERILGNDFEIDVTFNDPSKYLGKAFNEAKLLKLFGLISNQSETLVALDADNNIKEYDNIGQILYEYIVYMLGIYKKRKDLMIFNMEQTLIKYTNRAKFIQMVNDNIIIAKGKKKSEIEIELAGHFFEKLDDSYDYLTQLPYISLTLDKIQELLLKIESINKEIEALKLETHATLWLKDIEEIEKLIKKDDVWVRKGKK